MPCGTLVTTLSGCRESLHVVVALQSGSRTGVMTLRRDDDGAWTADDDGAATLLDRSDTPPTPIARGMPVASLLAAATRAALARVGDSQAGASPTLVTRLHRLARDAARRRDGAALSRLDRALRFVSTPGTTGSGMIASQLVDTSDRELAGWNAPDTPVREPVTAHAIAVVSTMASTPVFRSPSRALR
jgi:hypothetical protein